MESVKETIAERLRLLKTMFIYLAPALAAMGLNISFWIFVFIEHKSIGLFLPGFVGLIILFFWSLAMKKVPNRRWMILLAIGEILAITFCYWLSVRQYL